MGVGIRWISQGAPIEVAREAVCVTGLSQRRVVVGGRRRLERMARAMVVKSEGLE